MPRPQMLDGNEAAAFVAYQASDVIAIYPITPSSPMGELADQWASEERPNARGAVPTVIEMQSEGGAAGVLHGALQAGAMATTFTASQGLLLMIPTMYKVAGELTPTVFHVAARALATQSLSIFGDHGDVMATRATGWAMLASGSVQEAMDLALVAHSATLAARVPFVHFFDGFRTSHEVAKVEALDADDVRALLDPEQVASHRARGLSPDRPVLRGTAANPDVYFQLRETANPFYLACPALVQAAMDQLGARTGRHYHLFDYVGAPDADRVLVLMGSAAETVHETVEALVQQGERVGVLKVRLYRPFDAAALVAALPPSVRRIAVLDRTKEPGSAGEPLYLDVVAALAEDAAAATPRFATPPRVVGGRYGLGSKEFTPGMAKALFDELRAPVPRNHFTIGIHDDVTHTSLAWDPAFTAEPEGTVRAVFFGLGSDGTVGANKNSIKIIGEETALHAQGYFVYDSKKAGSVTVSHLRFGPTPLRTPYLIADAGFVACHRFSLLERLDVLGVAAPGATVLLAAPFPAEALWDELPRQVQETVIAKRLRLFTIDAARVAKEVGLGTRLNTVMQTCFFALAGVLPRDEAIAAIKRSIEKSYARRGEVIVERNFAAVDGALAALHEVPVPTAATARRGLRLPVAAAAPPFVQRVTAALVAGRGDELPVSALPVDGTWPTGTAQWEKRGIAAEVPVWDESICIQCGKCLLVCPHAVLRATVVEPEALAGAPDGFKSAPARWRQFADRRYTLQVSSDDCTGCRLCVEICPVKNKSETRLKAINMAPHAPLQETSREHWAFFRSLPAPARVGLSLDQVKDVQLLPPLFEFSGACAGCGETPYLKLLSQLFGDRALVANATGCSSIYGGNLPTTPWTTGADGRGPAWCNSLFEDNAEFGLGLRVAFDQRRQRAEALLHELAPLVGEALAHALLTAGQSDDAGIAAQRTRVAELLARLATSDDARSRELSALAEVLVDKSVWIVGGDGWAYDIGFGGLDHVLASGRNVKVLVLDTEVYSNTGGQMSKATPRGAVAKFAAGGKQAPKKDLALLAMAHRHVYVASVAMGGDDGHTVKVLREAEAFDGPALVLAYSHCIAHGYDLVHGMAQQKLAVQSGYWPLFRYDPRREEAGENPFRLDSKPPSIPLQQFAYNETRYSMLAQAHPDAARSLLVDAQDDVLTRWRLYERLSHAHSDPASSQEAPHA